MDYVHLFKFILIGDSRVGKSSLLSPFTDGSFEPLPYTVGVQFASRCVTVEKTVIKLLGRRSVPSRDALYFRSAP